MLMGSMLPLAFADESGNTSNNVVIDAETQKQVEIMNNGLGAETVSYTHLRAHET